MSVFDITNRCNLKCVYCCRGESLNKNICEIPKKDVLNAIRQIIEVRGNFIVLQGGGPLLRKDFVEIVREMKSFKKVMEGQYVQELKELMKLGVSAETFAIKYKKLLVKQCLPMYFVSTNGTIYTREIEEALYESGFAIDISLDSFDKEVNEKTRIGIDHDKVCQNIRRYASRIAVSISCTVTEENVDHIHLMIENACSLGAVSVKFSPVIMVGNRKENDEVFRVKYLKSLEKILDDFEKYSDRLFLTVKIYKHCLNDSYGKRILERLISTPNILLEVHECAACIKLKELYVDPNLNVYGCASMKNEESLKLGNLYSQSLIEIWRSDKRLELKDRLSKHIESAKDCNDTRFSRGGLF